MKPVVEFQWRGAVLLAAPLAIAAGLLPQMAQATPILNWETVVNNGMIAPTSTPQPQSAYYFSYNQPSVNDSGLVVFRARAKPLGGGGGGGGTTQGVYTRDMGQSGSAIQVLADNKGTPVPAPNTTGATFIEFPSIPRIDATSNTVAFRGRSQPVYTLPDGTKTGTSGVFTNPGGTLITGANQLGDAGFTQFAVPNAPAGTGFDEFPGAPSVTGGSTVVFKGNYTVNGVSDTGVFFRNTTAGGGTAPVQPIAQTGTPIPGFSGATFGSTAPPSAAGGKAVFTGFNNETAPTAGGIYLAPLTSNPTLKPLVSIGSAVPGAAGQTFTNFGEALAFDGKNVGFWGAWGSETMTVHMNCPTEGNAGVIAYCKSLYPNGTDLVEPLHQGIFTLDTATGQMKMIAQTGQGGFTDFMSWNFSGQVPGSSTEGEPARWRSSAYVADSGGNVVFLGQKSTLDGLYFGQDSSSVLDTLLTTDSNGQSVDPAAPAGSLVSSIGLERDGFRNDWLAISVGMLDPSTSETWGGIYVATLPVPEPGTLALLGSFALGLGALWRRHRPRTALRS